MNLPGRPELNNIAMVITRADDLGGAQVHVLELASALKARGYDVKVLAGGDHGGDGILFNLLKARGVKCRHLKKLVHPIRPGRDLAALKELHGVLQELKPDLVATHSNKAGFLGRLAARSLNLPVVHTSHGFLFNEQEHSPAGRFYRLMEKTAARLGDQVISVSESEYLKARALKVIPAEKMRVIHNGLPAAGKDFRADPARHPPRLIMVARFAAPKDHLTLLKALADLKALDWHLDLIGEGPEEALARRQVEKTALKERVTFRGTCSNVPQLLASAQIFVLSSRREGFPLCILEAMRAGLPVVASDVGGVGEAVLDNESGLLFAPGDEDALGEQLATLLKDRHKRENMGASGRRRFLEHFTLEKMCAKTIALYESLI